jgi:hypothetical protein
MFEELVNSEKAEKKLTQQVHDLAKRTAFKNPDNINVLKNRYINSKAAAEGSESHKPTIYLQSNQNISNFILLHEIGHLYCCHTERFKRNFFSIIHLSYAGIFTCQFVHLRQALLFPAASPMPPIISIICYCVMCKTIYSYYDMIDDFNNQTNTALNNTVVNYEKEADDFAIKYSTTNELFEAMEFFEKIPPNKNDLQHPPAGERYNKIKSAYLMRKNNSTSIE